jgi:hypothetical protein
MADDTYTVERSVDVDAPPERVYAEVVDLHRWTAWSPWEDLDPDLRRSYTGPESGTGSVYEWSGNRKAGQGRMEITGTQAPGDVRIALDFLKPFKSHTEVAFAIRPAGEGSAVTWTLTGRRTLMLRVLGLFTSMDKMIGPDFEKGLARLKTTAES